MISLDIKWLPPPIDKLKLNCDAYIILDFLVCLIFTFAVNMGLFSFNG